MGTFGKTRGLIKDHEISVGVPKASIEATETISPILPRQFRQSRTRRVTYEGDLDPVFLDLCKR